METVLKMLTYHGSVCDGTLVGMSVAGTLSSDGQVPEGVKVPPEGGTGGEGEVGDGHLQI